jgi:hypothetical protein
MHTRRKVLAVLAAAAALIIGVCTSSMAAQPTIEIIALSHWPVQEALKPVRGYLGTLGSRVRVVELNAESPEGAKRINAVGLKGHIPILLLINGSYRFKRTDGTALEFKDFPAKANNPLGLNGTWTLADFQAAVDASLGASAKQR